MKKLLLFVVVASAATFASCKKPRTCTCTGTSTMVQTTVVDWQTSPTTTTTTTTPDAGTSSTIYADAKKRDAKKACIDTSTESTDVTTSSGTAYNSVSGTFETYTTTTTYKTTTSGTCSLK